MPSHTIRQTFPFTVASVSTCRRVITDTCFEHGVDRIAVEEINLVVGELVMNAIRHGRPRAGNVVEVAWAFLDESTLRLAVHDGGQVDQLRAEMPSATSYGGRGLGIVDRLCRTWSYDTTAGTEVIADIPANNARHRPLP